MADTDWNTAGETPTVHPELAHPFAPAPGPRRPSRRRLPWVLAVLFLAVYAAIVVLEHWNVNYYAITPGQATPVAQYIDVPAKLDHPLTGKILLTDVYVTQLNALSYLKNRYFSSDSEVVPTAKLLGPSTPENQFYDQGYLEMAQAQSDATAAALLKLGYPVTSTNAGTLVYGIATGSPAAKVLKVAQVIEDVDYTPTPTDCALVHALYGLKPHSTAVLHVENSTIGPTGNFVPGPVVTRDVTLGTPPRGDLAEGCGRTIKPTAFLGIQPETQLSWKFPVKVQVHTADIGGPSAGLAMTLGIIDKLSGGHLTGNRIVAATGTIDAAGDVGDVGGVAEKTIAVERAGATVFFVPPQELSAARSKATPQLHVFAVSSLDQALRDLQHLGGTLTAKHAPAQAAP